MTERKLAAKYIVRFFGEGILMNNDAREIVGVQAYASMTERKFAAKYIVRFFGEGILMDNDAREIVGVQAVRQYDRAEVSRKITRRKRKEKTEQAGCSVSFY